MALDLTIKVEMFSTRFCPNCNNLNVDILLLKSLEIISLVLVLNPKDRDFVP